MEEQSATRDESIERATLIVEPLVEQRERKTQANTCPAASDVREPPKDGVYVVSVLCVQAVETIGEVERAHCIGDRREMQRIFLLKHIERILLLFALIVETIGSLEAHALTDGIGVGG